jgi:hypothetical protein
VRDLLHERKYTDKDGIERYESDIIVAKASCFSNFVQEKLQG